MNLADAQFTIGLATQRKQILKQLNKLTMNINLQYEFMAEHREIVPDAFLTYYSVGSKIITNYTDKEFYFKGKKLPQKIINFSNNEFIIW